MICDGCDKEIVGQPAAIIPGDRVWCKDCWAKEGQKVNDALRQRKPGDPLPDFGFDPRKVVGPSAIKPQGAILPKEKVAGKLGFTSVKKKDV